MRSVTFAALAALAIAAAGSAGATTIYTNGPVNGTIGAFGITGPDVADSFTVSSDTSAWDMSFGVFLFSGDRFQSVTWDIYTGNPFTSALTPIASGVATPGVDFLFVNSVFDVYDATISLGGVALTPGTYWIELSNGVTNNGDPVQWDENEGPSAAWDNFLGAISSESFTISTPEPATWALMLAGFAGLGAALRSRRRVLSPLP